MSPPPDAVTNTAGPKLLASLVLPVYNGLEFTEPFLETLFAVTPNELFELVIIDNASTDGTGDFLASTEYPVKLISNDQNAGFGRACNQGVQQAVGKFIIFMNNDMLPELGWLENLTGIFDLEDNVGIAGSKLVYPDDTIQHAGIEFHYRIKDDRPLPWPYHLYRGLPRTNPQVSSVQDHSAVTGAGLCIPRELFNKVGGFDEQYFLYFEDLDLCMSVRDTGKRVVFCPASVLIHYEGQSGTQETIDDYNIASSRIFYERWKAVIDKNLPLKQRFRKWRKSWEMELKQKFETS